MTKWPGCIATVSDKVGEDGSMDTCIKTSTHLEKGGRGEEREGGKGGREGGKDWEGFTSSVRRKLFPRYIVCIL